MFLQNSMVAKLASKVTNKKKKYYTREEKIANIKKEFGLVHGKGKRKKKYNKGGKK